MPSIPRGAFAVAKPLAKTLAKPWGGKFGVDGGNPTLDNFLSRCEHKLNAWAYAQRDKKYGRIP
jgi:hypothetical protein